MTKKVYYTDKQIDGMIHDITRLKGVREKDIERMVKYQKFYLMLKA